MRFTVSFNFLNSFLDMLLLCYPGWPPAFGLKQSPLSFLGSCSLRVCTLLSVSYKRCSLVVVFQNKLSCSPGQPQTYHVMEAELVSLLPPPPWCRIVAEYGPLLLARYIAFKGTESPQISKYLFPNLFSARQHSFEVNLCSHNGTVKEAVIVNSLGGFKVTSALRTMISQAFLQAKQAMPQRFCSQET